MALSVLNADRITNLTSPDDPNDKTEFNADNIMLMLDKILNGSYNIKFPTWTTATRPGAPEAGQYGHNTTLAGLDIYDGAAWTTIPLGTFQICFDYPANAVVDASMFTFHFRKALTITGCFAEVDNAPTGADLIIEIKNGANSIFSGALLTILATATSGTESGLNGYAVFAAGQTLKVGPTQIGSTVAGGNHLRVTLLAHY